jgi:TolB-like protein/Flp pilus assembly protein TadD
MIAEAIDSKIVRFHHFAMDLKNRELRNQGRLVKLQPQPFKVLALLVNRAGEVVTRSDIQQQIWSNDTFVDFDQGINFCIKQIRAALGDDAAEPRYLQTLPRRGYRFIAPLIRNGEEISSGIGTAQVASPDGSLNKQRLAVLPFACICPAGQSDYVADGLTEELIVTLSKIKDLRLIARTSVMQYKEAPKSAAEIGRELSVGTILEGSVRTNGKVMRVNTELIDTASQETLWTQDYERELGDVFAVQADIAQRIADALEVEIIHKPQQQIERWSRTNVEAYDLFSRGRYFCDKRTRKGLSKAVEYFEKAIGVDTTLAMAHAGLAEALVLQTVFNYQNPRHTMPQARTAATKALELDETLSEAHNSLAMIKMFYEWDLQDAESRFQKAIEINPSNHRAHLWCSICMAAMRRLDDEVAQIERARELAPLSININAIYGAVLRDQGRYDRAMEHLMRTIEMEPNEPTAHTVLAGVYAETGMFDEWIEEYNLALTLRGEAGLAEQLSRVYVEAGYRGTMQRAAEEMVALSKDKYVSAAEIAGLYAEAGKMDEALTWLEKAFEARDPHIIFLQSRGMSPTLPRRTSWHQLRSDPRFQAILNKMGLERTE